jgi:transposase-like protein
MELHNMDFNPFDILPDECVPLIKESAVEYLAPVRDRIIPTSITKAGNNGNNITIKTGSIEANLIKRREGRASTFTEDIASDIIEALEDGSTMKAAAKEVGVTRKTLWTWMQLFPEFSDLVARAREIQGHSNADDAVDILDNSDISSDDAKQNMAQLRKDEQRARIRMQLAECFNFKQYGSKKQTLNLNLNADVSPVDLSRY